MPVGGVEFYFITIIAVLLLGLGKGGFSGVGLLSLPLMALVLSPLDAAAIMLPILLMQDAVGVWAYRKTWDGRSLLILLPSAIVGILVGFLLVARISDSAIELSIGLLSIAFGTQQLLERTGLLRVMASKPGVVPGLVCGACGGFASMLAQAGGPPVQVFLQLQRLERNVYVGTLAMFFAATNLVRLPAFLALGSITEARALVSISLFPVAVAASALGIYLVRRTSGTTFYLVVNGLLVLVGIKLAFDGYSGL